MDNPADDPLSEHVTDRPRRPQPSMESFDATLKEWGALRRLLEVDTPEGIYFVEYNGWGLGYESVQVNGKEAVRATSVLWFVPRFEFRLGRRKAVIEVSVWPWLRICNFCLRIDGVVVYEDA